MDTHRKRKGGELEGTMGTHSPKLVYIRYIWVVPLYCSHATNPHFVLRPRVFFIFFPRADQSLGGLSSARLRSLQLSNSLLGRRQRSLGQVQMLPLDVFSAKHSLASACR